MAATGPIAVFYASDAAIGAPDEAVMDRGCMASLPPRVFVKRTIFLALTLTFFGGMLPAAAQTVVGGGARPPVTVNQDVLDSLGPSPTLPELLQNRRPERHIAVTRHEGERAPLHRTAKKSKKKKAFAKAKPKHKKPAVAAKRAAPVAPVATHAPASPQTPAKVATTTLAEPTAPKAPPANDATAAPAAPTPPGAPAAPTAPAAAATAAPPPPAPPGPVPTASPSSAAEAAMNAPPAVPAPTPVAPTPLTPAAAPATVSVGADHARVLFAGGAADLPDNAKPMLDAMVAKLRSDDHARLQLVARASGSPDEANEARRVSLQRALAVRSYLMQQGVAATRMDVRALGNRSDGNAGGPLDRVDVVMLDR